MHFRHLFQSFYALLVGCMLLYTVLAMSLRHSALRLSLPLWLLLFVLLALLISIAAYPLSRRITGRLARLRAAVAGFGGGDFRMRAPIEGRDEIADLARGFNDAAERIEALITAHRRLLANASHELRTPLTRIRLGVELIKDAADPQRRAELSRDVRELDELLEEILLASRLEAMPERDEFETVDLPALVVEEAARYPDVELDMPPHAAAASIPPLHGNPRLLRRALRNLLDNAARHGAAPTVITLEWTPQRMRVSVRDAGPGIAEADLDRVFEPFYRGRAALHNVGSGLGLSLVRQIAVHHGGTATCARLPDGRSAFVLDLPCLPPDR